MIMEEGVRSIYAGLSASLLRQAIYGTARIGLHRTFSDMLVERNQGKPVPFQYKVLSGMGSGAIAVSIGTPLDVALVRMQADSMKPKAQRRGYRNAVDAIYKIARNEGFPKLYSGLLPNVLRGMSMNVGQLAVYDQAKELVAAYVTGDDLTKGAPSMPTQLMAACVASCSASVLSLPFDLIKSRLQDGQRYKGVLDAVVKVLTQEGVLAFWTGFGAYFMRTAPHAMIILLTTEPITNAYKKAFL